MWFFPCVSSLMELWNAVLKISNYMKRNVSPSKAFTIATRGCLTTVCLTCCSRGNKILQLPHDINPLYVVFLLCEFSHGTLEPCSEDI